MLFWSRPDPKFKGYRLAIGQVRPGIIFRGLMFVHTTSQRCAKVLAYPRLAMAGVIEALDVATGNYPLR